MSRAKILAPFLLDLVSFCEAFAEFTSILHNGERRDRRFGW